jgi:hypothetical protein
VTQIANLRDRHLHGSRSPSMSSRQAANVNDRFSGTRSPAAPASRYACAPFGQIPREVNCRPTWRRFVATLARPDDPPAEEPQASCFVQ